MALEGVNILISRFKIRQKSLIAEQNLTYSMRALYRIPLLAVSTLLLCKNIRFIVLILFSLSFSEMFKEIRRNERLCSITTTGTNQ